MLDFSPYKAYSYAEWLHHFKVNKEKILELEFSGEPTIPEGEAKLLYPSIADFQRGEASEGLHLKKAAEIFACENGQPDYAATIHLFIEEENTHSSYLELFMTRNGLKLKKASLLDSIFTAVRRVKGIESEVTVLVTAEIIAIPYYAALRDATSSPQLKRVCERILEDEVPHIAFQSFTLGLLPQSGVRRLIRRVLMLGTCAVIWLSYRPLFKAGGYSFTGLVRETMGILRNSIDFASEVAGR